MELPICATCHHPANRHRMTTTPPRKHKECSDGLCSCPQYVPAVAS